MLAAVSNPEHLKMRRVRRKRLSFLLLAVVIAGITYIMHSRIGGTSVRILQEIISFDHDEDKTHHHSERLGHNHDKEAPFILRDSHLDPAKKGVGEMKETGKKNNQTFYFGRPIRTDFNGQLGDGYETPKLPDSEKTIAIGLALTTREQTDLKEETLAFQLPFFKGLLSSFCRTATIGYDYNFYVGHDHDDPFFSKNSSHQSFTNTFYNQIKLGCPKRLNVTLHLVECNHAGNPAWAQNDAMMAAYMDNMAYYYRVNDDTIMETTGWSEKLIEQILRTSPPNVGVVGPYFKEGNTAILTHDFVHRSHVDIFGFYYPRVFTDWFADDWITGNYNLTLMVLVTTIDALQHFETG